MPVHVVPSRGLAQGLAALVAYRTDQPAAVLAAAFAAAAAWAGSAEVPGGGNDAAALREAVGRALAPGSTLVTVLAGRDRRAGRRSTRSRTGCADGAPGRRARAARGRTGAPALLRER